MWWRPLAHINTCRQGRTSEKKGFDVGLLYRPDAIIFYHADKTRQSDCDRDIADMGLKLFVHWNARDGRMVLDTGLCDMPLPATSGDTTRAVLVLVDLQLFDLHHFQK